MRHCAHEFYKVRENSHFTKDDKHDFIKGSAHVIVACVYCGQVRHVYETGQVDIIRDEGVLNRNPDGKITI